MTSQDVATLPGLAVEVGRSRGGHAGFFIPTEDGYRPVSCRDWAEAVDRLACGLRRLGVSPGDRVVLMLETRYEWLQCDLAIMSCGAWTVPVYPNLPASQLRHPVEDSGARIAIAGRREQAERLLEAASGRRGIDAIILLEGDPPAREGMRWGMLRDWTEGASPSEEELRQLAEARARIRRDDPATILYTSGTSSVPKGVVLTHDNILGNARSLLGAHHFDPGDRYLAFLPLAHILERTVEYALCAAGVTIAYGRGIDSVARDAGAVRPTFLLGVPRFFERVLHSVRQAADSRGVAARSLFRLAEEAAVRRGRKGPAMEWTVGWKRRRRWGIDAVWDDLFFEPLRERLGGGIRFVVSGSAPLGARESFFFTGAGIPLLEGYGLTEAGPVVSVNTLDAWKARSVGRAIPGVELRLADDAEILVRSPGVMPGYWNLDAESRAALEGGWLHTGDLGEIDEGGFLTITGRKKDLIVTSGGKNISPLGIEERLRSSPLIQEAVLFGDRRPYLVALILPDPIGLEEALGPGGSPASRPTEARALLRREIHRVTADLAPHERVRAFDILDAAPTIEAGTLTPTLKLRRGALEAAHADRIAALYEGRRG